MPDSRRHLRMYFTPTSPSWLSAVDRFLRGVPQRITERGQRVFGQRSRQHDHRLLGHAESSTEAIPAGGPKARTACVIFRAPKGRRLASPSPRCIAVLNTAHSPSRLGWCQSIQCRRDPFRRDWIVDIERLRRCGQAYHGPNDPLVQWSVVPKLSCDWHGACRAIGSRLSRCCKKGPAGPAASTAATDGTLAPAVRRHRNPCRAPAVTASSQSGGAEVAKE